MVGLVVATHGRLADELVATAEHIVGKLGHVATVSITPGSSPELIREQVASVVHSLDEGQGVIVMADLFGGTPCKESLRLCGKEHIEVLAGVNLPMLLKANSLRTQELQLDEMARELAQYGQKCITCASDLLRAATSQVAERH